MIRLSLNLWPIARKIDDSIRPLIYLDDRIFVYAKDALKFAGILKQVYRIAWSLNSLPESYQVCYQGLHIDWDYELKQSTNPLNIAGKPKDDPRVQYALSPENHEKYERLSKYKGGQ